MIQSPAPEWPFQHICMDMMELNHHGYLACTDRYTGWLMIFHIRPGEITSARMISICRDLFQAYGAPQQLSTDGQTIFTSQEFQNFLKSWGVAHRLSSVDYPQSNGRAELAVKRSASYEIPQIPVAHWTTIRLHKRCCSIAIHQFRALVCRQRNCCYIAIYGMLSQHNHNSTNHIKTG